MVWYSIYTMNPPICGEKPRMKTQICNIAQKEFLLVQGKVKKKKKKTENRSPCQNASIQGKFSYSNANVSNTQALSLGYTHLVLQVLFGALVSRYRKNDTVKHKS